MTSASQTTPGLALNGPLQDKIDQVPKQLPMNDSMDEVRIIYYSGSSCATKPFIDYLEYNEMTEKN